jgi:hypothetical protein
VIGTSYQSMAASPLGGGGGGAQGGSGSPDPYRSAAAVWSAWRSVAEPLVPSVAPPLPLSQIDRRRTGRLAQARGPLQLFAAEQASICEVMAYIVTCERPGRSQEVRDTILRLASERRSAGQIFEQMIAAERAMLELWLIRLFEEDPS